MGWISATDPFGLFLFSDPAEIPKQLEKYRPAVGAVLRLLCSIPKSAEREALRGEAFKFLHDHGQHVRGLVLKEVFYDDKALEPFNYASSELERFKEYSDKIWAEAQYQRALVGNDTLPLGILVPTRDYQDLADPICDFLLSEYQRHLNKEVSWKGRGPVVPIFVCPQCKKLVVPSRVGRKQYCSQCSDQSRARKYREKAPPFEAPDYAWLYRLKSNDPGTRKAQLRQQKVQRRLKVIKSRQKESRRCLALLEAMNL
ncbi:MAG: hypothetical protein ACLPZF_23025 [Candidatus Acidiferrales bacterium]